MATEYFIRYVFNYKIKNDKMEQNSQEVSL